METSRSDLPALQLTIAGVDLAAATTISAAAATPWPFTNTTAHHLDSNQHRQQTKEADANRDNQPRAAVEDCIAHSPSCSRPEKCIISLWPP